MTFTRPRNFGPTADSWLREVGFAGREKENVKDLPYTEDKNIPESMPLRNREPRCVSDAVSRQGEFKVARVYLYRWDVSLDYQATFLSQDATA